LFDKVNEGGDLRRIRQVGGMSGAVEFSRKRVNGVFRPGDERHRCPRPGDGMGKRLADSS
jgi:hypothetical protein